MAEPAHPGKPQTLVAALLILGLAAASLFAWLQVQHNADLARERFHAQAQRVTAQLLNRLQTYETGVRGARGAVAAAGLDTITRRAFRAYHEAREIDQEFPGARGFGIIRRVPREREAAFVDAARRDDMPGFAVRELAPHERERYLIQYIEPVERNRQAVGLDIASEENRRSAARQAIVTGKATLTAPITLVQATGQPLRSFLLLLPIYRPGMPVETAQQRDAATSGWSYAPLVIDEILRSFDLRDDEFALAIDDATPGGAAERFFASNSLDEARASGLAEKFSRELFGREWQVEVRARPRFVSELNLVSPLTVFAAGAIATALLAALLHAYLLSRQRKMQGQAQQARLLTIVENSNDAIIGQSLDGQVTSWNRAAERIFGYTAREAEGRSLSRLIVPPGHEDEAASITARVSRGANLAPFDTVRRRLDGSSVDVSISAAPIKAHDGRVVGVGLTVRDISDQKAAERQLREFNATLERQVGERTSALEAARRDLRTILDTLPSMVGYWDSKLINRFANHAYHACLGVEQNSLPGRHLRELIGEQGFEQNRPHIEAALRGQAQTFEWAVPRPDGRGSKQLLAHYMPDQVGDEVRGFYVLVHDITELTEGRQRLAAALRENEALLNTLHRHALVSVTDCAGRITDANAGFCKISGYSREELLGQDHRIVNSGTHPQEFWIEMWQTLASGKPWRGEICNRARDGSLYWVDSIVAPFFGDDGRIEKYISIRSDITARRALETALRQKSEVISSILENLPCGLSAFNADLELVASNSEYRRLLEFPDALFEKERPEFADFIRFNAMRGEYGEGEVEELVDEVVSRAKGPAVPHQFERIRPNGMPLEIRGAPMPGGGFVTTYTDVTERKTIQRELEKRTAQAEQANVAKSQFLANMSHEIRTPLNAVIGLSYLLEQTAVDQEQRAFLGKIQVASRSLLGLINDVLDLSKIESNELVLEEAAFNLPELLRELAEMMSPQAQSKGLVLIVHAPDALPQTLLGDPTRLRQILTNLLSNALKFTERGEVELTASCEPLPDSRVMLRCAVRDTGIGIVPDVLERLFTPFTQADASTTRRFGGTGLGLSIVRHLANLMGGEVGVRSTVGEGSVFWAEVPLALAPEHLQPVGIDAVQALPRHDRDTDGMLLLPKLRALVVDDSEINREVARRILEREGAQVDTRRNGLEALERLTVGPGDFDVVLMDVQMPVMDGNEATRRVRNELGLVGLPIIAVTAGALVTERQRALDAGMNDFVSKPLNPKALIRTIRLHVERARGAALPVAARDAHTLTPHAKWPEIEGIDSKEVAQRLGGDVALFLDMIERMLREFGRFGEEDAARQALSGDATERSSLAARMHKLRGSAAMLGAEPVRRAAQRAEEAFKRDADGGEIAAIMRDLASSLRALAERTRPLLAEHLSRAAQSDHAPARATSIDATDAAELRALLAAQDLSALGCFDALSGSLRATLGDERFERLRQAVNALDFDQALRLLDELPAKASALEMASR